MSKRKARCLALPRGHSILRFDFYQTNLKNAWLTFELPEFIAAVFMKAAHSAYLGG
jgi:hypothetical protein